MAKGSFSAKLTRSVVRIQCMDPIVETLTPAQLAAVHVMKHEMLASIHRLYMQVPEIAGNTLLQDFITKLSSSLPEVEES